MFINKKVKDCYDDEELDFIVANIKPKAYYVVEIKFSKQNVKHKCIMGTGFEGEDGFPYDVELFSMNYEDVLRRKLKNIYYFRIISEIKDMGKLND
jgi:hypothetical protein